MRKEGIGNLVKPLTKMKVVNCSLCGKETFQGNICAPCKLGIPQIHQELVALLTEDNNHKLLKKLGLKKRKQTPSLN